MLMFWKRFTLTLGQIPRIIKKAIHNRPIKLTTLLGNYEKTYPYPTISVSFLFAMHRVTFRFFGGFYRISA